MSLDFVPVHVRQWVCEMQQEASKQHVSEEAKAAAPAQAEPAQVCYNDIETEVIEFRRRCPSGLSDVSQTSSEQDDESQAFGRHMFQNKQAHRVVCLLASARLIASFSGKAPDDAA